MYQKIINFDLDGYIIEALHMAAIDKAAFVLSTGRIIFCDLAAPLQDKADVTTAHTGAILSCAIGVGAASVISGGDDGHLVETDTNGITKIVHTVKNKWRDPVISGSNITVCAAGKDVVVLAGGAVNILSGHPSTVSALALNANGKRVAAAHYGGVSVWYATASGQTPKKFNWKGSHISAIFSPDDKFIMTGTQEHMLHGWFLKDGRDFEMAGYPSKIKSMAWDNSGKYLCTSGAETMIAWDCSRAGPMGRYPLEIGERGYGNVLRVAPHPVLPIVALGHESGALALANIATQQAVMLRADTNSDVTALSWSERGDFLMAGCANGYGSVLDFR